MNPLIERAVRLGCFEDTCNLDTVAVIRLESAYLGVCPPHLRMYNDYPVLSLRSLLQEAWDDGAQYDTLKQNPWD